MSPRSDRVLGPLAYQAHDSPQTFAEGLEEYYEANSRRIVRPADLPEASARLFRDHDLRHGVFGLGISLEDEVMADARALLSSDLGLRRYLTYMTTDETLTILLKETGYLACSLATLRFRGSAVRPGKLFARSGAAVVAAAGVRGAPAHGASAGVRHSSDLTGELERSVQPGGGRV
jgi:hypothetical protein